MMKRSKQEIMREQYDQSAEVYNSRYRTLQREKFELSVPDSWRNHFHDKIIIDIGCGTGLLGENLRDFIPSGRQYLVGIDISLEMIKQARVTGMYECIIADAGALPLRDNHFTVAISYTTFQNLPDWRQGVQEMFRVLAPGAAFVASVLKSSLDPDEFFSYFSEFAQVDAEIRVTNLEDCIARGTKA
jgi:ubiquinone/menaquinone biosynthesis C-methylase UbiE